MTCPKGHMVPDKSLGCPVCLAETDRLATHNFQVQILRQVVLGERNYELRVIKGYDRHVQMFSSKLTFCGSPVPVRPLIEYALYNEKTLAGICAGCRIAIQRAVEEAMA